jgi:hypothetical protein
MKKLRNIPLTVFIVLLVFGILFFLSGCSLIKSSQLRAIEDAASVLQLTTGREVERWTQDKGTALGKPIYAQVLIVYEPINNHTKKEVFDEIVAILEKNNWESEPVTVPDYFRATLQQGQFKISTRVSIGLDKNLVTIVITIY